MKPVSWNWVEGWGGGRISGNCPRRPGQAHPNPGGVTSLRPAQQHPIPQEQIRGNQLLQAGPKHLSHTQGAAAPAEGGRPCRSS